MQGELENALCRMLKADVRVFGSGRTDSGVHALGQAANFFSPHGSIPETAYVRALNALLPQDIRVLEARFVPPSFNARFSAASRVYRYFIQTTCPPTAFENRYRWIIPRAPDIKVLNDMCGVLKGELDFATFCASGGTDGSTKRYVREAFFTPQERSDGLLMFQIEANAFLWRMVRSLVGTLVYFESRGKGREDFETALTARDRRYAGPTAPAKGLFLYQVKFAGAGGAPCFGTPGSTLRAAPE